MPEISSDHIVEVVAGTGKPSTMRLRPGEPFGPLSVGTGGAWPIEAAGILPQHAELYFNGSQLYVRSSSAEVEIFVNGRPVLNAWTLIDPPCELGIGRALLRFVVDPQGAGQSAARAEMREDDESMATDITTRSMRGRPSTPDPAPRSAGRQRAGMMLSDEMTVAEPSVRSPRPPDARTEPARSTAEQAGTPRPAWDHASDRSSPQPAGAGNMGPPKRSKSSSDLTRIEPLDPDRLANKRKSAIPAAFDAHGTSDLGSGDVTTVSMPSLTRHAQAGAAGTGPDRPPWTATSAAEHTHAQTGSDVPRLSEPPSFRSPSLAAPSSRPAFGAPPASSHPALRTQPASIAPAFGAPPASSHPAFRAPLASVTPAFGVTQAPSSQPFTGAPQAPSSQPSSGILQGSTYRPIPMSQSGVQAPQSGWNAGQGTMTTPQVPTGFRGQTTSSGGPNPAAPGAKPASAGMSLPMKLTAVLFLPMVLSVVYLFMGDQLGLTSKRERPAPSASSREARAALSASTSKAATDVAATASSDAAASTNPPAASAEPTALAAAPASATSNADEPPALIEPTPGGKRPGAADAPLETSGDEKQKGASGRTLQREAADAVAAGAYGHAAKLYEELARKYPNKPAYAEAALILRAKTPSP